MWTVHRRPVYDENTKVSSDAINGSFDSSSSHWRLQQHISMKPSACAGMKLMMNRFYLTRWNDVKVTERTEPSCRFSVWLTKKRQVDLTVGASGNFSDSTPADANHRDIRDETSRTCVWRVIHTWETDLPQWNTAFTSRLSDKYKSGFRLSAYESDRANEQSTWLKPRPWNPVNHPAAPPTRPPSIAHSLCVCLNSTNANRSEKKSTAKKLKLNRN